MNPLNMGMNMGINNLSGMPANFNNMNVMGGHTLGQNLAGLPGMKTQQATTYGQGEINKSSQNVQGN